MNKNALKEHLVEVRVAYGFTLHLRAHDHTPWFLEVSWINTPLHTSLGLAQSGGHGSWLMCVVALSQSLLTAPYLFRPGVTNMYFQYQHNWIKGCPNFVNLVSICWCFINSAGLANATQVSSCNSDWWDLGGECGNEANNNTAMIGENRQLVTDEPVEFEK